MITIRQPLYFSHIGQKDNQEDYLYPHNAGTSTRVFVLCDGMGGHDNGEVASRTAAEALGGYLAACPTVDVATFEEGLARGYAALDAIGSDSVRKPGTTMAALCLNEDSYLVAHIGDSRIYHIRPSLYNPKLQGGGVLYQSSDHSLVNDLLKAGELTEEEARDFPQKNVITRAMQPRDKRYKADVFLFDDIQAGDYFFICCDGVLEQLSNTELCRILADSTLSDQGKMREIESVCMGRTRDNFSCWLIPIDKVEIGKDRSVSSVIMADVDAPASDAVTRPLLPVDREDPAGSAQMAAMQSRSVADTARRRIDNGTFWLMFDVLFLLIMLALLWFVFMRGEPKVAEETLEEKMERVEKDMESEKPLKPAVIDLGPAQSAEPETVATDPDDDKAIRTSETPKKSATVEQGKVAPVSGQGQEAASDRQDKKETVKTSDKATNSAATEKQVVKESDSTEPNKPAEEV